MCVCVLFYCCHHIDGPLTINYNRKIGSHCISMAYYPSTEPNCIRYILMVFILYYRSIIFYFFLFDVTIIDPMVHMCLDLSIDALWKAERERTRPKSRYSNNIATVELKYWPPSIHCNINIIIIIINITTTIATYIAIGSNGISSNASKRHMNFQFANIESINILWGENAIGILLQIEIMSMPLCVKCEHTYIVCACFLSMHPIHTYIHVSVAIDYCQQYSTQYKIVYKQHPTPIDNNIDRLQRVCVCCNCFIHGYV